MTIEWDELPSGVFAFTSDGMRVGEVDADRFEIERDGGRFWLPTSAARDLRPASWS